MANDGQFKPGTSGNPAGRPKQDISLRELARQHTEVAIQTLADLMENPRVPPSTRTSAASALLDRGWGRPAQYVETTNTQLTFQDFLDQLSEDDKAENYDRIIDDL